MQIYKKYIIKTDSDLLFAKIDISNTLKKEKRDYLDFFVFAVMELGTNILKYANEGEIWLLKDGDEFLLSALDKGNGINNLKWATKKGTSTKENSLGLGLFQLSKHSNFELKIFTCTDTPKGTIILLKSKALKSNIINIKKNYMDMKYSGDFCVKKGKYIMVGDVSGHGLSANKSANFIKSYFLNHLFSCICVDEFLSELGESIKQNKQRSAVLTLIEIDKHQINICGVGDMGLVYKDENKVSKISFKSGIVGDVFESASKYCYDLTKKSQFFIFSDGIEAELLYNICKKTDDMYLTIISTIFHSKRNDDKIIVGITRE